MIAFLQGTIVTLEDFGMIVKLSDHIKGLCSRIHLADIILKHPEKKLTDGKKVTCRVSTQYVIPYSADHVKQYILFSLKPFLCQLIFIKES